MRIDDAPGRDRRYQAAAVDRSVGDSGTHGERPLRKSIQQGEEAGRLVESGPEFERLKKIGGRLIRQTAVLRDDTHQWKWHLSLKDAPILNATCVPGGKITFYTGIIRQLNLTDDEIAAIMGHEIAHAIREHGREKVSQALGQQIVVSLAAARTRTPEQTAVLANQVADILYTLPHSRETESEADKVGLELMARAGYPEFDTKRCKSLISLERGPL